MSDPFHPYAALFENPKGPGDARPTALQVVEDNDLVGKWEGKVVLITGGTAGIGTETARALAATGANIFITARDLAKGQKVADDIAKSCVGKGKVSVIEMDMMSLDSVKKAAKLFLARSSQLNILINNAGIMAIPTLTRTHDGHEQQFGVNHLAHYTLTALLLPTMVASSSPSSPSRLICVTSAGHGFHTVRFSDPDFATSPESYNPWHAYGQSKTANLWLANYVDRAFGGERGGVRANAVHPGGIVTGLWTRLPREEVAALATDPDMAANLKSPEQGGATTVWAATAGVFGAAGGDGRKAGGNYLYDCGVGEAAKGDATDMMEQGYAPHAFDPEGEDRLWEMSGRMTGVVMMAPA